MKMAPIIVKATASVPPHFNHCFAPSIARVSTENKARTNGSVAAIPMASANAQELKLVRNGNASTSWKYTDANKPEITGPTATAPAKRRYRSGRRSQEVRLKNRGRRHALSRTSSTESARCTSVDDIELPSKYSPIPVPSDTASSNNGQSERGRISKIAIVTPFSGQKICQPSPRANLFSNVSAHR